MRAPWRISIALLTAVVAAAALHGVRETVRKDMPVRGISHQEVLEARVNNAFAGILGEIRATTADFLYAKSVTYRFNGIVHAMPSAGAGTTSGEGAPVIREADRDFRGLIGYLERQVKPHEESGRFLPAASEVELLPWYRLMTVVDPSNLNSFISGSHWLASRREYQKAMDLIDEGLEKNPGHPLIFHLHLSKAKVYSLMRDFEPALKEVEIGLEWALQVRPESGTIGSRVSGRWIWSELAEEDFFFLLRYRALFLMELGRHEEALQAALAAYRVDPNDAPTSRILERLISGRVN